MIRPLITKHFPLESYYDAYEYIESQDEKKEHPIKYIGCHDP